VGQNFLAQTESMSDDRGKWAAARLAYNIALSSGEFLDQRDNVKKYYY
jgi:hypothetical protein